MNRKQRRQVLKNSGALHKGKGSRTMTQRAFEAAIKWYQREALEGRHYPLGPEVEALVFPNGVNPLGETGVGTQVEDPSVDPQPPT